MPSSPLKRPSGGGGRLRRLLASLRPPTARAGLLPVQTGFPTSLADLVVKNHGRFHNPRRRHRAPAGAPPPSPAPAEPVPQPRREELSVTQDQDEDAAAPSPAPAPPSPKTAAFGVRRPELLAVGGAVALALLLVLVWSKLLVAASVALFWIESASRSRASTLSPRRPPPETRDELSLRARVSPIRAAEAQESPRPPSCADSEPDSGSSEATDGGASVTPERKEKRRRSLRRLLAKKLMKRPPRDSRHGGEYPVEREVNAVPAGTTEPTAVAEGTTPSPPVAVSDDDDGMWHCRRRVGALPLAAVAPIVLVSLAAGKLPAVALTVLCAAVFSSSSISRESWPRPSATS